MRQILSTDVLLGEGMMMKHIAMTVLCLALTSCVGKEPTVADAIDTLVTKLNASHGMWINGIYPIIELPHGPTQHRAGRAIFRSTRSVRLGDEDIPFQGGEKQAMVDTVL